jgi:hypothetical protein
MRALLFGISILLLAPLPALAHHSFAAVFDDNLPVDLEGEVTKIEWANPHIWVYLDVMNTAGEVENWQCEGGTPNSLRRLGWSRETLREGDPVHIEGWRARDGSDTCNMRVITKDGRRLFAGSSREEQ